MAEKTSIEWTDSTFNPWTGCTKVSPGCDRCYAESWAKRSGTVVWGAGQPRRRTTEANWSKPLTWERDHTAFLAQHGRRQRVFIASLADWADNQVPIEWPVDLLHLCMSTPHLDKLMLTKRIGNVVQRLQEAQDFVGERWPAVDAQPLSQWITNWLEGGHPPADIWLGATVVNQVEADRDIPKLLATPARVRFLSVEPMLEGLWIAKYLKPGCERHGALDRDGKCEVCEGRGIWSIDAPLADHEKAATRPGLNWVICGGESGPGARPMHPDWARGLRDQCQAAGVAFFMKQMGGARDKRGAIEDLPEDLRVREFPHANS